MRSQKLPHEHRHFRRIRDFVKRNSSSHTPLNFPSADTANLLGNSPRSHPRPIYQTGPSYYSHGAELHPNNPVHNPISNYSLRNDINTADYHYVPGFSHNDQNIKQNLDESFYEGAPNRTAASQEHSAGLKGMKVLEPGMQTENEINSTTDSSPDTKRHTKPSPQPLANLADQSVSCGLQNLGNTCYMNSVLQCLFNIEALRAYFLQGGHLLGNNETPLTQRFVELLSTSFTKDIPVDRPLAQFKDALEAVSPVFEGYAQNDAHEFFRLLIEKVHDELNNGSKKDDSYIEFTPSQARMTIYQLAEEWKKYSHERENSIITSIFGGILLNEVNCSSCHYVSYTFEDALDLSLNLANTKETSSSNSKIATSLYMCLKRFTTPEPVEGYACENCHKKDTSFKRTTIWKQPQTLVVQFKRFVCDNYGNRRALKERVSFPVGTMTLDYFTHEKSNESRGKFKLQGIVNHYGDLNGGHYIAYVYNDNLNCWLKYNDHQVSKVDQSEIHEFGMSSIEPYILFYKRV